MNSSHLARNGRTLIIVIAALIALAAQSPSSAASSADPRAGARSGEGLQAAPGDLGAGQSTTLRIDDKLHADEERIADARITDARYDSLERVRLRKEVRLTEELRATSKEARRGPTAVERRPEVESEEKPSKRNWLLPLR